MEGDYEPQRHIAMMMKCGLWILYGLPQVHKDNILVTTTNGISLGIQVIYLVLYCIYCEDKSRRDNNLKCTSFDFMFVEFSYVVTLFVLEDDARHIFIGVVCTVFTIVMYAWLFRKTMVDNQSFQYMPLGLSFVSFINAAIWTAYSLIYQIDIYVLICNGLGTLACASQFIVNVYLHYTPTLNAIDTVNVIDV